MEILHQLYSFNVFYLTCELNHRTFMYNDAVCACFIGEETCDYWNAITIEYD